MVSPITFTSSIDCTSGDICDVANNQTPFFSSFTNFGLNVYLYADYDAFYNYKAAVDAKITSSTATTVEINNADEYSDYVMRWDCDLQTGTLISGNAVTTDAACCLQDLEDTLGGGYCLAYAGSGMAPLTYRLTEENFNSLTSDSTASFTTLGIDAVTAAAESSGFN